MAIKAITLIVTQREHAAILAGLRMLQRYMESERGLPPGPIQDILTNGNTLKALSAEDIDRLCEKSNHE